jgi:tetratricopeptide (TPR) repeat protein
MKNYFLKIIFLFLLLFLLGFQLFSQRNIEKGDRYFDQNQFEQAIKFYQLDIKSRDRKTAEYAMQKLADCYRITGEFEKAEETYKKILKRKKKNPLNYLNYGLSLKNSAKYAEAIIQFEEYIKLQPEDQMGKIFLLSCDSAQKWLDETIGKEVKNLENINTELSEFSPAFGKNEDLYFCSSREGSTKALISFDGGGEIHRLDLYSVKIGNIETKEKKKNILLNFKGINTPMHEGPACFSSDGSEVYFTKTVKGKRDKETNEVLGTLQVFYSAKDSAGKWSRPISAFSFNNRDYSIGHPSLSADGKIIYYMSDKPGGKGKTDIYYSVKQSDGNWGPPINAGDEVNTFGFEMFPTISPAGDLYFSSNAHPGMGQLDIFKSSYINGKWSQVHNLKPPVNSIANDFGIAFDGNDMRGFFSSDRFNGKGNEDIYSFSEDIPLPINVIGGVLEFPEKSIYDDIRYKLINENDSSETELVADGGKYFVSLSNSRYILKASKNGMPYNKIQIEYSKDTLSGDIHIKLQTMEKPVSVEGMLAMADTVKMDEMECVETLVYLVGEDNQNLLIYTNGKGYFKFDNNLEATKTYTIRLAHEKRNKVID